MHITATEATPATIAGGVFLTFGTELVDIGVGGRTRIRRWLLQSLVAIEKLDRRGVRGLVRTTLDASVMPRISRGYANAPTTMIIERAVDMVGAV